MDGGAGAARWLSVVGCPKSVWTKLPSKTDVPCGMVGLSHFEKALFHGHFRCRFIVKRQGECIAMEFASLGLEQAFTRPDECGESIPHL
jgi:hypothetical protein